MLNSRGFTVTTLMLMASIISMLLVGGAKAATAENLSTNAEQALQTLFANSPGAEAIASSAKAVLIFPRILRAGFVFGGSYGEGVLMREGTVVDYYNSVSGSWGLQLGAQTYGYAVFLMTEEAVTYLERSNGWEVGVGPTVVLVDEGLARNISSTTLQEDAYAFIFGQQGLMAGITFEGTKISRIDR